MRNIISDLRQQASFLELNFQPYILAKTTEKLYFFFFFDELAPEIHLLFHLFLQRLTLQHPWLTLFKTAVCPPIMTVSELPLTSLGIFKEKVAPILYSNRIMTIAVRIVWICHLRTVIFHKVYKIRTSLLNPR